MATTRTAQTHWEGSLIEGAGRVSLDSSGLGSYDVTWASRAEDPNGRTSPEELIAAAHSSCYSMALSNMLAQAGTPPQAIDAKADVTFQPGEGITGIHLTVVGHVEGIDAAGFAEHAEKARTGCPVSQALTGTTITLDASLA
ncbi:MAG: OsmC family protein [Nocardioidaceae bacterium]